MTPEKKKVFLFFGLVVFVAILTVVLIIVIPSSTPAAPPPPSKAYSPSKPHTPAYTPAHTPGPSHSPGYAPAPDLNFLIHSMSQTFYVKAEGSDDGTAVKVAAGGSAGLVSSTGIVARKTADDTWMTFVSTDNVGLAASPAGSDATAPTAMVLVRTIDGLCKVSAKQHSGYYQVLCE
jgi:hypothetical protein